jgi:hypothetical protein
MKFWRRNRFFSVGELGSSCRPTRSASPPHRHPARDPAHKRPRVDSARNIHFAPTCHPPELLNESTIARPKGLGAPPRRARGRARARESCTGPACAARSPPGSRAQRHPSHALHIRKARRNQPRGERTVKSFALAPPSCERRIPRRGSSQKDSGFSDGPSRAGTSKDYNGIGSGYYNTDVGRSGSLADWIRRLDRLWRAS